MLLNKRDPKVIINSLGIAVASFNDAAALPVEPVGFAIASGAYIDYENRIRKNLIEVKKVIVNRVEGNVHIHNINNPKSFTDFYAASRYVNLERQTIPDGGSHKFDITAIWPDQKPVTIEYCVSVSKGGSNVDLQNALKNIIEQHIKRSGITSQTDKSTLNLSPSQMIHFYMMENYALGQIPPFLSKEDLKADTYFILGNYTLGEDSAFNTNMQARSFYNCCTELREPHWEDFEKLEICGCISETINPLGDQIVKTDISKSEAEFFSIYGKKKSGEWEAITDQEDYDVACAIGHYFKRTKGVPFTVNC